MALEFEGGSITIEKNIYPKGIEFSVRLKGENDVRFQFTVPFLTARAVAETIVLELKKVEVETRLIAPPAKSNSEDIPF